MTRRAEAFIIEEMAFGKRVLPTTTEEAEELVKKGDATKLRQGLYRGTKPKPQPKEKTRALSSKPKRS